MNADIQRMVTPQTIHAPQPVVSAGPGGATAASPTTGLAQQSPSPRAEIKVDFQEMAKNLERAIDQINTAMRDGGRGLNFVIDGAVNQPIIKVMRAETGEVIRQIPNEVVVRVAHNLEKLQGVLFSGLA